jgi:hypothetical protein
MPENRPNPTPGPNAGLRANVETPAEKRGRGRPKGSEPKVRPEIPADQFTIDIVEDTDLGNYRRRRLERTEQQQAVDTMVLSVYTDWKLKGRPSDWSKMPVRRWIVDKNVDETARFMLRKAAALHGRRLIFGREVYVGNKSHITFIVTDRKESVPEGESQPNATAEPESTPAAT